MCTQLFEYMCSPHVATQFGAIRLMRAALGPSLSARGVVGGGDGGGGGRQVADVALLPVMRVAAMAVNHALQSTASSDM